MPNFAPTQEQELIVNAILSRENVTVRAGAGTGKTSACVLGAEALPSSLPIAYIAFNKPIALEARHKMPMNVDCQTMHAYAWKAIVKQTNSRFGKRLKGGKVSGRDTAALLGENNPLTYIVVEAGAEHERVIKPSAIGYAANKTVERFCQQATTNIEAWHCPKMEGLDEAAQAEFAKHILPLANRIWADIQDENGHMFKFDHCHYLKMYQLSGADLMIEVGGEWRSGKWGEYRAGGTRRKAEVIFYDEAQDASPVTQAIIQNMVNKGAQVIVVGDQAQAIYAFTGAQNAMDKFNSKHNLKLTKSFRFGPAIADFANQLLDLLPDNDMRIVGHDPVPSVVIGA